MKCCLAVCLVALAACATAPTAQSPEPQATVNPVSPVLARVLQRGELVVGTAGSMPPMNMRTNQGKLVGLDIDLARYVAGSLEVKARFETMPFASLLPALEAGTVDMVISSMTITPSRNRRFAFVGPYVVTGKSVMAKRETLEALEKATGVIMAAMTVTALEGSTSQFLVEKLFPQARLITTQEYEEAVRLVVEGKADAMFADLPVCLIYAYRNREVGMMASTDPLTFEPLGIAVPPDDPLLVNFLQNLLLRLEGSGELDDLRERWLERTDWVEQVR